MSHTHICIEIFRLHLEIFHTLACFHTLVWEKSYTSMGKRAHKYGKYYTQVYGKFSIACMG